jgi:hypothetical protein
MKLLLKYKLLLISLLIISGCVSDKNITGNTYFGGKIINPKSNKVFFYQGSELLDSAKLNDKNKFIFKFDSLKVGLYTFEHGQEYQYIFLEPNDSLLLRLNTWDFDESLVFSGKGAEKNNLLLNIFLENEKEDKLVFKYYTLNDSLFEYKLDSLVQLKKLLYKHYQEDVVETSPLFDEFVNAAIYLPIYKKKEAYPYNHKRALKLDDYPKINPAFYKYRKEIDLNNENLQDFRAYNDYIRTYLMHISYEKRLINEGSNMMVNLIETTVNHIKTEKVKNRLLTDAMWRIHLDEDISEAEKKRAQVLFFKNCNDSILTGNIKKLISASKTPEKGSQLPVIEVINQDGNKLNIQKLTKDHNTVIYFWPKQLRQIENLAKRVNYLEKQYPNVQFIGINSKNIDYNWKSYIKSNKFNASKQFRLDRQSTQNDWLFIDYSRTILVDKNGRIIDGFTHITNNNFLKKFNNN